MLAGAASPHARTRGCWTARRLALPLCCDVEKDKNLSLYVIAQIGGMMRIGSTVEPRWAACFLGSAFAALLREQERVVGIVTKGCDGPVPLDLDRQDIVGYDNGLEALGAVRQ